MRFKQIGGTTIQPKHRAACHCGAVELELDLPDGVIDPRRCDCSFCRRRGTIVASVSLSGLHIVKGDEYLKLYQFNTLTARHYFCSICGIHTHHQRRSNPEQYGYNVGCLEGVNPFDIPVVPTNDGVNHPADRHGLQYDAQADVVPAPPLGSALGVKDEEKHLSHDPNIRRASISDVAFLENCTSKAYSKYLSVLGREPQPMTANYREMLDIAHIWVLDAANEQVALLVLEPREDHLLIYSIAVDPRFQRQGYGQLLMQFAEQEALRQNYRHIQLYTNELMKENIRWYQHLGYIETHCENYKGSVLVYMEKDVGADV